MSETCPNTFVDGDIPDDVLDREVTLAFGPRREAKEWKNKTDTVEHLLERLVQWRRGDKDGAAFIQGKLGGSTQRMTQYVEQCDILMVDVDTGMAVSEIVKKIRDCGLFGVVWTTYSHTRPTTEVAESAFLAWCKKVDQKPAFEEADLAPQLVEYLKTEKKMEAYLFPDDGIDAVGVTRGMTSKGVAFTVSHQPCPRSRALFVLDKPFSFLKGGTKKERDQEWKERYGAFSTMLGLPYDRSCTDPARLMYLPALSSKASIDLHAIHVIAGRMVDIEADAVIEVAERDDNPFVADAAEHTGHVHSGPGSSGGKNFKPRTPGLMEFVAKYPDFDPIAMLQHYAPEDFRGRNNTDTKIEFMCPFEDGHSSSDPEQVPFFVSTESGGWYMGCRTDGCSGNSNGDRLYFLDAILLKHHIGIFDIKCYSPTWMAEGAAYDAKQTEDKAALESTFDKLTEASSTEEINACLEIARKQPSSIDQARMLKTVRDKTKLTLPVLTAAMKTLDTAARSAETEAARAAGASDDAGGHDDRAPAPPEDLSKVTEIHYDWEWPMQIDATKARIIATNAKDPKLFQRPEGGPAIRIRRAPERVYSEDVRGEVWDFEIGKRVRFKKRDPVTGVREVVPPPRDMRSNIAGDDDLGLPVLRGFQRIAVPATDGSISDKPGYNPSTQFYFDPNYTPRELPDVVTMDDVDEAVGWVYEALRDFPFSDAFDGNDVEPIKLDEVDVDGFPKPNMKRGESSRTHAFAMLLEPMVRNFIKGSCPAYHIDKAQPGTGAGYLTNVLYTIMTGETAEPLTMSESNEEFGKTITATLRAGGPLIFIDNINVHVDSADLASALTNGYWRGRILGRSEIARVPIQATWVMAGNNLTFSHELMRRVIPIRMDAATPNPAQDRGAKDFKHFPLQRFLNSARADLIWSLQVIAKYWVQEGSPRSGDVMNSFDEWSAVMGGIFKLIEVPGFRGNVKAYLTEKDDDEYSANAVVSRMTEAFGDRYFRTGDLYEALKNKMTDQIDDDIPITGNTDQAKLKSLGKLVNKEMVGATFDIPVADVPTSARVTWAARPGEGDTGQDYYRLRLTKRRGKNGAEYRLTAVT